MTTPPCSDLVAPDLADFRALADAAFAELPAAFRARCGDVVLIIEDFADDATLRDMGIADPFDLTGLYSGVPLTEKSASDVEARPDEVRLYRRPILDEWAERGDETLGDLIAHVLVHEIGHHFGLTDDDIEALEAGASD